MKPDKEGIWEWFDENGTKRLVDVCNVDKPIGQVCLRVYWWGGYYNVNDEHDTDNPEFDKYMVAEWADRWGNYVGPRGCVAEEQQLYWMPTPEQMEKILKRYEQAGLLPNS